MDIRTTMDNKCHNHGSDDIGVHRREKSLLHRELGRHSESNDVPLGMKFSILNEVGDVGECV